MARDVGRESVEVLDGRGVDLIYQIVVEEEPEAV